MGAGVPVGAGAAIAFEPDRFMMPSPKQTKQSDNARQLIMMIMSGPSLAGCDLARPPLAERAVKVVLRSDT